MILYGIAAVRQRLSELECGAFRLAVWRGRDWEEPHWEERHWEERHWEEHHWEEHHWEEGWRQAEGVYDFHGPEVPLERRGLEPRVF